MDQQLKKKNVQIFLLIHILFSSLVDKMTIPIKNSRSQWKVPNIIEKPICVCVCLPAGRISGHGGGSPRRNSARTVAFSLQQHTTHK